MYLLDTNVISELRKRSNANGGVLGFFRELRERGSPAFISVIAIGELRRGVELVRHRGDAPQAAALERWLRNPFE